MSSPRYTHLRDEYQNYVEAIDIANDRLSDSRNRLYIVSLTTIGVFVTNAVPTSIEPLGIDFTALETSRVVPLLSVVSGYFLLLFIARYLQRIGTAHAYYRASSKLDDHVARAARLKSASEVENSVGKFASGVGNVVAHSLLTVCPLALGAVASGVGFFPWVLDWLKQALASGAL